MRTLTVLMCMIAFFVTGNRAEEESVRLTVKASADPTHAFSKSKLYVASVVNESGADLHVEAVQMPGGYLGSGVFFPCSVEKWNSESSSWALIRRTQLKQFTNPAVTEQEVKPGKGREVCRALLPKEGARNGECVRFRLSAKFGDDGPSFVSRPFTVGSALDARATCIDH
jgi:hypothetical protein